MHGSRLTAANRLAEPPPYPQRVKRLARRLLLALAVLTAGLASCGGDGAEPPATTTSVAASVEGAPTSSPTTTGVGFEVPGDLGEALLILPPLDQGVLIEQRWLDYETAETWAAPTITSDGLIVTLEACRVRYPGQWAFDVTLDAPPGVEFPITLGLDLGWGHGDVWTGPPPVEVDLVSAGAFTVVYDSAGYLRDHIDLVLALDARQREEMAARLLSDISGSTGIGWEGAGCSLSVHYSPNAPVSDPMTYQGREVTEEVAAPEVTAVAGTVEYLAQTADLTAGPSPGRSWAQLYGHGWMPAAPVVWMEPDRAFSSLSEHWTLGGRCYTIRIEYHFDDLDPYQVWQYQGCPSESPVPGQPSAVLEVHGWTIVAAGEDQAVVDAAIERLRPFFVTNTWPAPPMALGDTIAETTFEGALIYLVSLDYGDAGAGIFLESPDIDFSHGPMSGANGESFRGCWQTTVYQDAGIALVLVGDPTWDVRIDGVVVELQEAEGGIGYALLDWTSQQPPVPTITDAQGITPCT